jgi:hypothetical protein
LGRKGWISVVWIEAKVGVGRIPGFSKQQLPTRIRPPLD